MKMLKPSFAFRLLSYIGDGLSGVKTIIILYRMQSGKYGKEGINGLHKQNHDKAIYLWRRNGMIINWLLIDKLIL